MPALAFVLVERAVPPDPIELVRRAASFGCKLVHEGGTQSPATYSIGGGGILMVMLIDAPHPDAPKMTPSLVAPTAEDLQRAKAHYIVVLMDGPTAQREQDILLARLTAAVVRSSPDERMSMLTHGLVRYGREEFFVTASQGGKAAMDFIVGLARWMLMDPNKQLPTGDTVGRTPHEKVRVQRVPNPTGEGPEVIRLDLDL